MAAAKCAACGKTAYPLESLNAVDKVFHKICFKCEVCGTTLHVKNFKGYQGKIYCFTHTPVERTSTAADSVTTQNALKAPKKSAEGLGNVQKGTGETPNVGIETVTTQNALKAPKKVAEGLGHVQKGTGETPNVGIDTIASSNALKAPRAVAESLGTVHKGDARTAPAPASFEAGGGGGEQQPEEKEPTD